MPQTIGGIKNTKSYQDYLKKKTVVPKKVAAPRSLDYVPGSAQSPFPQSQQEIRDQAFIRKYQPGGTNSPATNPLIRPSGPAGTGSAAGSAFSPVSPSSYDPGVSAASGGSGSGATGLDQELTGWASGLKPDMLTALIMGNPDAFLRQIAHRMGLDPDENIGALQAAAPYIQGMNELALVMLGGNDDYEVGDMNSIFNWMGDFASQGMSPGGSMIDFSQGLNNLLGADTGGSGLNALESALQIGTPQEQANKMMSLAGNLASSSLHPYWADAFIGELGRQGDAWVSKNAGNNMTGGFNTFFKDRMGY